MRAYLLQLKGQAAVNGVVFTKLATSRAATVYKKLKMAASMMRHVMNAPSSAAAGLCRRQPQMIPRKRGGVPTTKHVTLCSTFASERCEDAVNAQIVQEYETSVLYDAMHAYFDRPVIALPGFAHFFRAASDEERGHAHALMNYMNRRGGRVKLARSASAPFFEPPPYTHEDVASAALYGMETALEMETMNYDALLRLHRLADEDGDASLADFVGESLLRDQVNALYDQKKRTVQLSRLVGGLASRETSGGKDGALGLQYHDSALLRYAER